ncbi:MAG: hypothetical protein ABW321_14145 [Polyangiales bacterium]
MGTNISRRSHALALPRESPRAPSAPSAPRLTAASELTFDTHPAQVTRPSELSSQAAAAAYGRAQHVRPEHAPERIGHLVSVRA